MNKITEEIAKIGIVPVVVIKELSEVESVGNALIQGGLPIAEITFRTFCAAQAITKFVSMFPKMLIGAGTVINVKQAQEAVKCGAKFIVSPGVDIDTIKWCSANGIAVFPGCITPTDVMSAMSLGIDAVKVFPVETFGGLNLIKALQGPFPNVKFIPTGGITLDNMQNYLFNKSVLAVGGSFIVDRQMIDNKRFDALANIARQAMEKAKTARV